MYMGHNHYVTSPARLPHADFGFGQARRRAEQFIKSFDDVYCLRRARVRGEEVRILRCYPGNWQVRHGNTQGTGEIG